MSAMASQITGVSVVYSTVCLENIKAPRHWPLWGHSSVTGEFPIQRANNSEMFPFDDVIMNYIIIPNNLGHTAQYMRSILACQNTGGFFDCMLSVWVACFLVWNEVFQYEPDTATKIIPKYDSVETYAANLQIRFLYDIYIRYENL